MPQSDFEYRFAVAISFAGDGKRDKIRKIADLVRFRLGDGRVFFDEWFESELAGHDANSVLQNIYCKSTQLVVTCVCQRYDENPWTQEEWRAIQAFERGLRDAGTDNRKRMRLLPLRFGEGEVDGLFETAIVPDVRDRTAEEIADLIIERLDSTSGTAGRKTRGDSSLPALQDATIEVLRSILSNEAKNAERRLRRIDEISQSWKADPTSVSQDALNDYVLAVGGFDPDQPNARLSYLVMDFERHRCLATTSEQGKQRVLLSRDCLLDKPKDLIKCFGDSHILLHETGEGTLILFVVEAIDPGQATKLFPNPTWVDPSDIAETENKFELIALSKVATLARQHKRGRRIAKSLNSGPGSAIDFLQDRLLTNDTEGLTGWTSMPVSTSVGSVSTAQGILCHVYAGIPMPMQSEVIDSVLKLQNNDGGWPVRKALRGKSTVSITESTLLSLDALESLGHAKHPALMPCRRWLSDIQDHHGGWRSAKRSSRSRTFPTALAIRVLCKNETTRESAEKGQAWIIEAQNSDGGWGQYSRDKRSAPAYTAHSIISLCVSGLSCDHDSVVRACDYLCRDADVNHRLVWENCRDSESVDDDAELHFDHFSLPWCISALVAAGYPLNNNIVLDATYQLMSMQTQNGYWDSSRTAQREAPLWETHDAIYAIAAMKSAMLSRFEMFAIAADGRCLN